MADSVLKSLQYGSSIGGWYQRLSAHCLCDRLDLDLVVVSPLQFVNKGVFGKQTASRANLLNITMVE